MPTAETLMSFIPVWDRTSSLFIQIQTSEWRSDTDNVSYDFVPNQNGSNNWINAMRSQMIQISFQISG